MSRDVEKQATYDAEREAFEGTPLADVISEEHVFSHYDEALSSPWWGVRPAVEVRSARVDMTRCGGYARGNLIVTGAADVHRYIVSHELAHVAHHQAGSRVGDVAHGAVFRSFHLQTVSHIFGRNYGVMLHETYTRHGLLSDPALLAPEGYEPVIDIDAAAIATAPTGGWRPRA